jgi:hypothetical protein
MPPKVTVSEAGFWVVWMQRRRLRRGRYRLIYSRVSVRMKNLKCIKEVMASRACGCPSLSSVRGLVEGPVQRRAGIATALC